MSVSGSGEAYRPSLAHRVERALARWLFRLPHRLQVLLSGRSQDVVEGQPLHPEMQLLLAARQMRGGAPLRGDDLAVVRRRMREESMRFAGPRRPLGGVRDLAVATPWGELPARHYAPVAGEGQPLLVFFHGGGFVVGGIESHDEPCRVLCEHAAVHVLSIDYRLAPEHPFPAAVDDAVAAFEWAVSNAERLGADPARVGVGGDSAGGNLAAVVAQERARRAPGPAFQLLVYPVVDRKKDRPSRRHFAEGYLLTSADMEWFDAHYLGQRPELERDPRVAPLLTEDLSGLCPAIVVTAGFDPLRDEGDEYAAALERHGVPTVHRPMPGLVHGFINMGGVSGAAEEAVRQIALELRAVSRTGS